MARFLHFFDSLEEKRRLSHIKNLIALAAADGHVDDCEVDFIAEVGARMGIKDEEVKRIFKHPESIKFEVPESEDEKLVLLYDYVVVMMADKIIDDNELTFCYDTVEKLGFRRDLAPEIISEIMTSIGKERDMDGTLLSVALILHK
jgi:hypothetical protein